MKEQIPHDSKEYIFEHYPIITQEQVDALVAAKVVRRFRKLRQKRTLRVNEKNGAILYYCKYDQRFRMAYYFIDPEHPKEIEYQKGGKKRVFWRDIEEKK